MIFAGYGDSVSKAADKLTSAMRNRVERGRRARGMGAAKAHIIALHAVPAAVVALAVKLERAMREGHTLAQARDIVRAETPDATPAVMGEACAEVWKRLDAYTAKGKQGHRAQLMARAEEITRLAIEGEPVSVSTRDGLVEAPGRKRDLGAAVASLKLQADLGGLLDAPEGTVTTTTKATLTPALLADTLAVMRARQGLAPLPASALPPEPATVDVSGAERVPPTVHAPDAINAVGETVSENGDEQERDDEASEPADG